MLSSSFQSVFQSLSGQKYKTTIRFYFYFSTLEMIKKIFTDFFRIGKIYR